MDNTTDLLRSLGSKLDSLTLNDGERSALRALFDAASVGDDVAGFASLPVASFGDLLPRLAPVVAGIAKKPLGGSDDGSALVVAKPLTGNDNGVF